MRQPDTGCRRVNGSRDAAFVGPCLLPLLSAGGESPGRTALAGRPRLDHPGQG